MSTLIPAVFVAGALAGGVAVWRWRARNESPGAPRRWPRLKLVASTALATFLLLAVVGYGLVRHRFQSGKTAPASVSQAVEDFRKTGSGSGVRRGDLPTPGVYTYHGQGFFDIDAPLFGKKHLKLPKTIPAILRLDGSCWELAVRPYEKREWTERYCRDGAAGFRLVWRKNKSDMFGIKSRSQQECRPAGLFGASGKPRQTWEATCRVVKHESSLSFGGKRPPMKVRVTYVGRTQLTIGGRSVAAHHLRQSSSMKGSMKGSMVREVWYAVETGMLLQLRIQGSGSGLATMKVDQRYTLAGLAPRR